MNSFEVNKVISSIIFVILVIIGINKLFYDVIYNPSKTNFLLEGEKLGNKIENGKMMFIYQAHQAFTLWQKIMPKIDDETIKILVKQSLLQAQMGCDVIAPSDMMDGRIGEIRKALDKNGFESVQILSYAVKYASNFYGPFRDAVGSKKYLRGDKKSYQMEFRNSKEALREVALDISEGADFVMVKPGMPYLDIIKLIKDNFKIPVFAYQVSGEYSLIKNGINNKILNEDAIIESLISFKRAGASAVVTYFAEELAQKLR